MDKKELYAMWEMSVGGVGGISPTNSVACGSIAGLPPDQPVVRKKLDGRKKDVRSFVKKLLTNRQKREEMKYRKSAIQEQELQESGGKVIDQLKKIANAGSSGNVVFDNGGKSQVSPQEAAKIVSLYRELNASNRVKMIRNINGSSTNYEKIKAFAQSRSQ